MVDWAFKSIILSVLFFEIFHQETMKIYTIAPKDTIIFDIKIAPKDTTIIYDIKCT